MNLPGIPYTFKDAELLREALTHRSRGDLNYERLEFLGDSVLNFVVASRLFELRPQDSEGELSRLRSRVVRGDTLARLAVELKLGDHLILGEGELKSGGFKRQSILADALEALFGAIFIDGGFEPCRKVIQHICDPVILALPDAETLKDPKTRLQEWLQGRGRPLPDYLLLKEEGAEHAKRFLVSCRLTDDGCEVEAWGGSRRKAEQAAAEAVLQQLHD
jgi:ribonuclease-3